MEKVKSKTIVNLGHNLILSVPLNGRLTSFDFEELQSSFRYMYNIFLYLELSQYSRITRQGKKQTDFKDVQQRLAYLRNRRELDAMIRILIKNGFPSIITVNEQSYYGIPLGKRDIKYKRYIAPFEDQYELKIKRISYNSPGELDFFGIGAAIGHLKDLWIHYNPNEETKLKNALLREELMQKRLKTIDMFEERGIKPIEKFSDVSVSSVSIWHRLKRQGKIGTPVVKDMNGNIIDK